MKNIMVENSNAGKFNVSVQVISHNHNYFLNANIISIIYVYNIQLSIWKLIISKFLLFCTFVFSITMWYHLFKLSTTARS